MHILRLKVNNMHEIFFEKKLTPNSQNLKNVDFLNNESLLFMFQNKFFALNL